MRKEIYEQLSKMNINIRQEYSNEELEFPLIVFNYSDIAIPDHDGIAYYDSTLDIEIFSYDSVERNNLEKQIQELMIEIGYINSSSNDIPDSEYYRSILTFNSIK